MPENKDIRRALDDLLGEELTADQLQAIQLFLKVATWNRIEEGRVTKTSPIIPGKFCESQKLLEVSGVAATGAGGAGLGAGGTGLVGDDDDRTGGGRVTVGVSANSSNSSCS